MAHGPTYKVKFRRRREGKTNYYKRYEYVKSKQIRCVIRKSNKYIWVQMIKLDPRGDVTISSAHSSELKKFGYKGDLNNMCASYLVGLLAGLRAKKMGINKAILDIGVYKNRAGTRLYSVLKGILDAGIDIPYDAAMLPNEDRTTCKHVSDYAKYLKANNLDKFNNVFSQYISRGLDPENIVEHVKEVIEKIKGENS